MRGAGILALCACLVSAQPTDEVRVSAHAYTPPQLHLTAQANLVQLEVVVRDPRGHPVGGLHQGDFEILDEGKPRDIAAFSVETREAPDAPAPSAVTAATSTDTAAPTAPPPRTAPLRSTMLFFDDLHSTGAELQRTQIAAKRFIKDGMGPSARAAIYAASEGLVLDFTTDGAALTAAIEKLRSHQRISENGLQPCPHITPYQAFLIDNNLSVDALNAAVSEARSCLNSTSTTAAPPRNPSLSSTRSTSPTTVAVRAQASATWQQAHTDALHSFDAIENALGLLTRAPGTRVLLMVSTGFLSGLMDADRTAAIDRAIHAGIVINALDAKGLWSEAPGRESETTGALPLATFLFETSTAGERVDAMNQAMQEFASGTGGLFFHNNNDLVGGFAQLAAVPETIYLLAIKPDPDSAAGKYHKLKVRLTAKNNDYVQARPGYFAPTNAPPAAPPEPREIDRLAMTADVLTAVPIQLAGRMGKGEPNDPSLSLVIRVDLNPLKFSEGGDRHMQKLMFLAELLDGGGRMVTAKEGVMDLALKDDTLTRLKASGINATLGLNAPPGPYKVRVVVQDADGKIGAVNQAVEIPK